MTKKYIIWGSDGHSKVLSDIILKAGDSVAALFDNDPNCKASLPGVPLFLGESGFNEWSVKNNATEYYGLVAIGGHLGDARIKINEIFRNAGVKLEPLIHNAAIVSPTAKLEGSVQVLAGAIIAAGAIVGDATILNHKASADHECMIGKGCHLAPNATLCGLVELGDNVMIAAGATVISRVKIGANTIIGAGSVVTKDIPSGVIAYGNPAKVIR